MLLRGNIVYSCRGAARPIEPLICFFLSFFAFNVKIIARSVMKKYRAITISSTPGHVELISAEDYIETYRSHLNAMAKRKYIHTHINMNNAHLIARLT